VRLAAMAGCLGPRLVKSVAVAVGPFEVAARDQAGVRGRLEKGADAGFAELIALMMNQAL